MPPVTDEPRWLTQAEKQAREPLLRVVQLLPQGLDEQLRQCSSPRGRREGELDRRVRTHRLTGSVPAAVQLALYDVDDRL